MSADNTHSRKGPDAEPLPSARVTALHAEHADFVWRTLQRLGVQSQDLTDMTQEVFVRVIRRLHTYDSTAKMTTWLFGIAFRIASNYHRSARRRREQPEETMDHTAAGIDAGSDPEQNALRAESARKLASILDEMDIEKRAVFVMFEIEGMSGQEIAEMTGVPVGTVHSRLFAARKVFNQMLATRRL